jgi:hypothetical protein
LILESNGFLFLGTKILPPPNMLFAEIVANLPSAQGLAFAALQAGVQAGNQYVAVQHGSTST